jgi:lipoate-protein ligase A
MQRLDLTLPTAAENVALDEALLEMCEQGEPRREVLRIWESPRPAVVLGRSSRVGQEVDEAACREQEVPIVRRSSGGAAIVAGPGCLMYAVVLSLQRRPELRDIGRAHAAVLDRLVGAVQPLMDKTEIVSRAGTSDLTVATGGSSPVKKFSGNSLRMRRTHLLYHGTLLYDFDLGLIDSCLRMPPRQPEYRGGREHVSFVTNLSLPRQALVDAIDGAWPTDGELTDWPADAVAGLVANRCRSDAWTYEF